MDKILDIHIIYCDKDKKYLLTLLEQCKNFRIENSLNNWKIFVYAHDNSGENNIGQFQRRLEIIRNTPKSHYVWFVDGDDEIINNADLVEGDFDDVDIMVFAHHMMRYSNFDNLNTHVEIKALNQNVIYDTQRGTFKRGEADITLTDIVSGCLWNKWVKASCWDGIYDYLKNLGYENITPNASEDCFFAFYAVQNAKSVFYSIKSIYFYHNERSYIFNDKNFIPYKNFKNFRVFHKEITEAISKLNYDKAALDKFAIADYCCHIQKALSCLEIKKALDNVVQEFGKEIVIKMMVLNHIPLRHPYVKYLAYKYLQNLN